MSAYIYISIIYIYIYIWICYIIWIHSYLHLSINIQLDIQHNCFATIAPNLINLFLKKANCSPLLIFIITSRGQQKTLSYLPSGS